MNSCLRIFSAVIVGIVFSALIFGGGSSYNILAKPVQAQLTNTQITGLLGNLNGLPTGGQQIVNNIPSSVFQELGGLTPTQLNDIIALDSSALASGFPGVTNATAGILSSLPNGSLDSLLSIGTGQLGNLGSLTNGALGQLDTFLDLGSSLGINPNTILGEFNGILGGNFNDILNTANVFSNFDIGNLTSIAGNLGVDFGGLVENITGSLNIDIDQFINFDFAELSGLGIDNLGDLIGNLGLPTSVLNGLAGDLGTTVSNLLNVDLANLDLLNIGGLDDIASLIGLDPSSLLNNLTGALGVNPEDLLGNLTGLANLDINEILNFDFSSLSGLGIDNLDDLASTLGLNVNTLLGNLSSTLNIPIADLANLDLDVLTNALDLGSIADISNIIGINPANLANNLSSALGLDLSNFTDISFDNLANLGLDNALDLANAISFDLGTFSAATGIGLDALAGTSIADLGTTLGVGTLGGLTTAIGGDLGGAIGSLGTTLGLAVAISPSGAITISLGLSIGTCSSGFCTGQNECACNGWCIGPSCSGSPGPCTGPGSCTFTDSTCTIVRELHQNVLRPFWDIELFEYERWLVQDWLAGYLIPSMMGMAEELTAVAMQQVVIIGSFFDAKIELETHRLLQEFHAQAHKDYHPSEGVCVFATNVRGLAMTQRKQDLNQSILSTRAANRHLGRENDSAGSGVESDLGRVVTSNVNNTEYRSGRLRQFQDTYCNPRDNNDKLRFLCGNSGAGATDPSKYNKDIDYYDVFASEKTLHIDTLRTPAETSDEQREYRFDYIALAKNLYGHEVPFRPPPSDFDIVEDFELLEGDYEDHPYTNYLDLRAMLAKRSVAENSFHAQAALKAQGDPSAAEYMYILLDELGIPGEDIAEYLKAGPSYYAQMEILTKKIYQNPQFYINLYDKPANVKRKQVALKAVGLMQDWDTLEVELRSEMLASMLLELSVIESQKAEQNR